MFTTNYYQQHNLSDEWKSDHLHIEKLHDQCHAFSYKVVHEKTADVWTSHVSKQSDVLFISKSWHTLKPFMKSSEGVLNLAEHTV